MLMLTRASVNPTRSAPCKKRGTDKEDQNHLVPIAPNDECSALLKDSVMSHPMISTQTDVSRYYREERG
jgi:hypothetical protein